MEGPCEQRALSLTKKTTQWRIKRSSHCSKQVNTSDVDSCSSTVRKALVDRSPHCISKTSPDLSNLILLRQFRKCRGSPPPTIWTGNHYQCVPAPYSVNGDSRIGESFFAVD